MDEHIVWPSVTPIPFQNVDGVWWSDGKPRCSEHRGRVLVRASALPGCTTDGGTHVCAGCMRVLADKARKVQG